MSAAPWQPPEPAPVRGRLDRERSILWLPDSLGLTAKPVAPPLAAGEVAPWVRPSAAACFPLHPAGVVELHARAAVALGEVLDDLGVTGEDRERIRQQCWTAACRLYAPGRPMRTALDEFVEQRAYPPSLTGQEGEARLAAQRTGLLAAWAVVRAAVAWAGEAE